MKNSKLGKNILTSLLQQAATVICGFILPRLILSTYGSAYNGIVNSVGQFLSCITLLRAGIGGVTRAALYRALESGDIEKTSGIIKATEQFMRKIAGIFCVCLLLFACIYPVFVQEFDWFFSFTLVLILGISTVMQYCFGITNQFLLHADQRLYVYNIWQIVAIIANTIFSVILINIGCSIHVVKLGSAVAFSITPVMMYLYVRKKYGLRKDIAPDHAAIAQRWDAAAHQVAAFVHSNTDIMVLTVFTDMLQVSVYVVYTSVAGGINQVVMSAANAIEAAIGKIVAHDDENLLRERVFAYEWVVHVLSVILFACAAMLIVPFVLVYTQGVIDVDYNQPLLGYFMCLAYWINIIRLPHQNVIETAGHFKQTKRMAIIEAVLNVSTSCSLVAVLGTVGVVIGTVIAMTYRTIGYAIYASKNILKVSMRNFVKRILVSGLVLVVIFGCYFGAGLIHSFATSISHFGEWVLYALGTFMAVTIITMGINYIFYPDNPLAKQRKAKRT